MLAGRMAGGGSATREKQIHATSDQCSEELPGGQAADVIPHEVPLAFQHHKEIDLAAGAVAQVVKLNVKPLPVMEEVAELQQVHTDLGRCIGFEPEASSWQAGNGRVPD